MISGPEMKKCKEAFEEYFKGELAITLPSKFKANANDIIDHSYLVDKYSYTTSELVKCNREHITDELLKILRGNLQYILENPHIKQLLDFNKDYFDLNVALEIIRQQLTDNKAKEKIKIIFLELKESEGYKLLYLCEDLLESLSSNIFYAIENIYAKKIQLLDEEGIMHGRKIDINPYNDMSTVDYFDPRAKISPALTFTPFYSPDSVIEKFAKSISLSLAGTPHAPADPWMDNFDDESGESEKEDRIDKLEELIKSQQEIIAKLENKVTYLESKYITDKLNDDLNEFVYKNASEYFENFYKSWGEEILFLEEDNLNFIIEDSWKKFLNKIKLLKGLNFNLNDKDVINGAKETYIESFLFKVSEKKGDLK